MKLDKINKVIVVGAGPAGLTFAYHAAIRGLNVKIYEARNTFAFKPCGEALAGEVLKILPFKMNYNYKWILSRMKYVKIYYNGKYYRIIPSPFGENGVIIDKRIFLQELADIVKKEGVKLEMGNFYKLGKEDADLIIDASGYLTAFRNFLNLRNLYQKEYRLIPVLRDYAESNNILEEGHLLIDLLDKGYFWIFPYGKDMYNIGIGGKYDGLTLKKLYQLKINQYGLKLIKNSHKAASVSIGGLISRTKFGKFHIIGEAAGYVMPTTGEGIRFSIYSAYEFFNSNFNLIKNMKKRIMFNAKLLKLAININSEIKDKLIKLAPETLMMVFLGEKSVNVNDVLKFLKVFIKNIPFSSYQNAVFSLYSFLMNKRI